MSENINQVEEEGKRKEQLPDDLKNEIDLEEKQLNEKFEKIDATNLKDVLKTDKIPDREIIEAIRSLPSLTRDDHLKIDELDKSKFRLWLMRQSEKDEFNINCKKLKKINKSDDGTEEFEYETDAKGVPILEPKLFFYSPVTTHQKKVLRKLETVANLSQAKYNKKHIESLQFAVERKQDTQEYWNTIEEKEKLNEIWSNNNEALTMKVAEFRLGVKKSEYPHIVESELLRYLAVASYKESVKNPQ